MMVHSPLQQKISRLRAIENIRERQCVPVRCEGQDAVAETAAANSVEVLPRTKFFGSSNDYKGHL